MMSTRTSTACSPSTEFMSLQKRASSELVLLYMQASWGGRRKPGEVQRRDWSGYRKDVHRRGRRRSNPHRWLRNLPPALQYWCRERLKRLEFLRSLLQLFLRLYVRTGTPRAVAPLVPMGANAGAPNNVEQQTQIVKATLEQLEKITTPGTIVPLPFEYAAKI